MIEIVQYRPSWPEEFLRMGRTLRSELGGLALRIDHIGSTSIPGLAAKDVLDIQVTAEDLEPRIAQALTQTGYRRVEAIVSDHVPPGQDAEPVNWRKWMFKTSENQRAANLHVRVSGRPNQRYPLLFRDYLRAHPGAARSYALIKMVLARLHPEDLDAYYAVKDPVCDIIMDAGEEWALLTEWQSGPSDA